MEPLRVEGLSAEKLRDLERPWNELLAGSDSHPLFMSWAWHSEWWRTYGPMLRDGALRLFAFYDRSDCLVGLVPLHVRTVKHFGLPSRRCLEFVGSTWRDPRTALTEFTTPIVREPYRAQVGLALLAALEREPWDDWVANLTIADGSFAAFLRQQSPARGWYVRQKDFSLSYSIDLGEGFERYLAQLSGNSRRHLFNQRTRLARRGKIALEELHSGEAAQELELLNRLHALRWGEPAFSGARLAFHRGLIAKLEGYAIPVVSILRVAGEPVSALYDIRCGGHQYNLQAGFDPAYERSVSLGLLHLGYAIESAAQSGMKRYDLLGGGGKRSQYKDAIANRCERLCALQVVRARGLKTFFRTLDALRGGRAARRPRPSRSW